MAARKYSQTLEVRMRTLTGCDVRDIVRKNERQLATQRDYLSELRKDLRAIATYLGRYDESR